MKKRSLILLAVTLASLSIASCSSNEQESRRTSESSGVTIPSSVSSSEPSSSSESSSSSSSSSSLSSSSQSSSSRPSSSSSSSSSSSAPKDTPTAAIVTITNYFDETKQYALSFELSDGALKNDSSSFSKDIAMFAFGNAIANQTKTTINKFYTDAGFDHISLSGTYDSEPTKTSIAYAFAHKTINGKDFISASIRGFNYGQEWFDNFNVGLTGEHNGFAARADIVNTALKSYLSENGYAKDNVQLLINGYSRGGAVANLLAKRVNDDVVAKAENIYAYTFEAPKGALERGEYNNIYNIISSGDIITNFAPEAYGFTRYGQDIDAYTADIDAKLAAYDANLFLPPMVDPETTNDTVLAKAIIDNMVAYKNDPDDPTSSKDVQTREAFVNNYQQSVGYAITLFMSLKTETVNSLKEGLNELGMMDKLGLITTEDALYNFLKPYIDADGVEYVDEELHTHINNAVSFAKGPGFAVVMLAAGDGVIERMIGLHTPEVNYVLLSNLQEQE